jgi:hypothetical protein
MPAMLPTNHAHEVAKANWQRLHENERPSWRKNAAEGAEIRSNDGNGRCPRARAHGERAGTCACADTCAQKVRPRRQVSPYLTRGL